jgi:hypothetical protein
MITNRKFVRRPYENTALVVARKVRVLYMLWARRCRKSTTLGNMAFDALSSGPGQSVIAASASLLVGAELVSMAMTSTEQAIRVQQEADSMRLALEYSVKAQGGLQLVTANAETGKTYTGITDDDYRDLYRSKRLEFRLHFDRTSYSRLLVIAPNPATARGWGGWVFRDEQQFTSPAMERELQIATKPIIDTDPTFHLVYASNLCGDDRHPGYEMTIPRVPTEFAPDEQGHLYVSQTGLMVHRVDLADAYAAGHTLFDDKGQAMTLPVALAGMTPSERKQNYMLMHEASGTAAVDGLCMHTAQQRGIGRCASIYVDTDADFQHGLEWLRMKAVRRAVTGVGFDVATTERGMSNPSSLTVTQQIGVERVSVLNLCWKTRAPKLARERVRRVLEVLRDLDTPARCLAIDGSNELYFAEETREELRSLVPVVVVRNGENVEPRPAGYEASVNYKTYLGDLYSNEINENHFVLPPEAYFKKDHRSVIKDRGTYSADVDADGGHGDTFDSGKLSLLAATRNREPLGEIRTVDSRRGRNIRAMREAGVFA